jgi:hypothetical protein
VCHIHIHNRYNCFLRIQQHQVIQRKIQHVKVKAETILEETEEKKFIFFENFSDKKLKKLVRSALL